MVSMVVNGVSNADDRAMQRLLKSASYRKPVIDAVAVREYYADLAIKTSLITTNSGYSAVWSRACFGCRMSGVRISLPRPICWSGRAVARQQQINGGRSSVGRVPDCDSGCRGFEPHRPPHFKAGQCRVLRP